MVDCYFTNKVVEGSNPVAVTYLLHTSLNYEENNNNQNLTDLN